MRTATKSPRVRGLIAVAALAALATDGCYVTPRTAQAVANVAAAAVITAAIVGNATVLGYHDPHYHYEHCGHHRRWHHGHWVYQYGGRWEYYEPSYRRWYYYR
jgi:hypothetical protein